MATAPATTFTPAYRRVEAPAESLDGLACIAMVTGKPLSEILSMAIQKYKLRPSNGPYVIDENRLQVLFAAYGFVAGNWREIASINDLPELCLVWQVTDPEMEGGRVLLYHRMKDSGNPKQTLSYVIEPLPQKDPSRCIRTEFADLNLSWSMAVTAMKQAGK